MDSYPDNFPRIVQIAYGLVEDNADINITTSYIKQSEPIPKSAIEIHGITDLHCEKEGENLEDVMNELKVAASKVDTVVGHNVAFDYKVVKAECLKNKLEFPLQNKNKACTMRLAAKQLGLTNRYIKLETAGDKLFGGNPEYHKLKKGLKLHDAESDLILTALIYNSIARN